MKLVLVVEDDKFMRNLLVNKLQKEGFQTEGVSSGEEALEFTKTKAPSLLLLDLILPNIDGFEVVQQLKQDPRLVNIPVLILSNLGEKKDIEKAQELGVSGFLIKANFTPSEIVKKVQELLSKKYI
ncbi:MAG: response regulator [Candidatus Niyogibacteria bacterium CG10_big_fil_rev_8_21_14_0_10_46_36]|uniref:Response regulator n=1 Tax=Candidatus Niyogibacteria bacterium CG10_big_fil_rev_8_21_14_0_10_46_36 TaxID=1974726 RepID=A0A2H0TDJ9_9BACT|nr:MAG: response regulator [Candidatus Niyogibacteria bacterium CG10_big_fil_rev_8_21_14_0_10_46_36]